MLKIAVYDTKAKEIEKLELPENVFGLADNPGLLSQAVRVYLANQRQGNASTKTRGEVAGSTRKIYRQKGTGKARHGSIRAPIFVKGGIVFGPSPREFRMKMPQKMAQKALYTALSAKLKENALLIISGLEKIKPKTKEMFTVLNLFKINFSKDKPLLVLDSKVDSIIRAYRNIKNTAYKPVNYLNTYDILNSNKIIFTKVAIQKFTPIKEIPKIPKIPKSPKPVAKKTITKKIKPKK